MRHDLSSSSGRFLRQGSAHRGTLVFAVGAFLSGCSGGHNDRIAARGNGQIGTITKAANDSTFSSPFDAAPSPDGSTVFFLAIGADGTAGVFSASAGGGAVARIDSGGVLVSPSGIAVGTDGQMLYVADRAADDDPSDQHGAVFSLSAAGGAPSVLAGTAGLDPRGVTIAASRLYFTGASSAGPAVYSIELAGGQPTPVFVGPPLLDPSAVAVTQDADVYVVDTIGSQSNHAAVIRISAGQANDLEFDLGVGYPAGITLVQDESALLVSGLDLTTGTDLVYRINLGGTPDLSSFNQGISTYGEPAGLHRAARADIYAWADSLANSTGTVYVLSK